MSQSIASQRFIHHNDVTVILMPRPASPGRAHAGLPTRLALSALVGLLSLLVVIGLPAVIMPGPDRAEASALPRPASDRSPFAAERGQPERPPRV